MNDHNLDDLIIDDIEPQQNQKAKSFLTIIALAIVVLIVAIIFTKIMLKTSNQEQLTLEQDETEMISPDLTLQSAPEPAKEITKPIQPPEEEKIAESQKEEKIVEKTTETSSEKTIVVESTTVLEPEEPQTAVQPDKSAPEKSIVEKVSESVSKLIKEEEPAPAPVPTPVEEPEVTKVVKQEPTKTAPKKIVEKETQTVDAVEKPVRKPQKPVSEKLQIQEVKKAEKEESKKSVEEVIEHAVIRPRPRPVNVITRPGTKPVNIITRPGTSSVQKGVYYIQVGAFKTSPSQRFLDRIKRSGFNYKITKRSRSGLKKLLIGPYYNRAAAENALLKVKDRINKKAFLHKKK